MPIHLRYDKVIRAIAPGIKRVYSICLTTEAAYLIRTGKLSALKYYRRDPETQHLVATEETRREVKELQVNESRLDTTELAELARLKDNYVVRLEAIEEVELKAGKYGPEMWLVVTGSEHHLFFPFASWDEAQTLQRALSKWIK